MKRIQINTSGLKCDNQSCDWDDITIPYKEWLSWIGKPCPKCSNNLLIESDYKYTLSVFELVNNINNLSDKDFNQLYETNKNLFIELEKMNITLLEVDIHNGVTLNYKTDET